MTHIEKEVVIRALSEHERKYRHKAKMERSRGEYKKASLSEQECDTASAVMMTFCSILTEPSGSARI